MSADPWMRYQFRWGVGQMVALLSLLAVFQLDIKGAEWILGGTLVILVLTGKPLWAAHIQSSLSRFGPKVMFAVVLIDFILSRGDFLPSLIRTLAMLVIYRALEFRQARQDRQLVLLALLLLLVTGTLTADLVFALELFVFVPTALLLLAVTVADESAPIARFDGQQPWIGFTWSRWWKGARGHTDRRIIAFASALYAVFGVATMLMFWAFPRFDLGYRLPFFKLNAQKSLSGFSETVEFGSVVEIKEDFSVAMRVDAPLTAATTRPYWRMMVLDEYFGQGFRQSESARTALRMINASRMYDEAGGGDESGAVWTHFIEGGISRQLPIPGRFSEMHFTSRQNIQFNTAVRSIALRESSSNMVVMKMDAVSQDRFVPTVVADAPLFDATGPRIQQMNDPRLLEYPWSTLTIPDESEVQRFLEDTVEKIKEAAVHPENTESFAAAATAWLQAGRGYSLNSSLGASNHPVVEWMRTRASGHCELYAASLVLLARQAGFPARMVTGFHSGVWNGFENYFMVRNADAHAWVEIFDGENGWQRFDPTPGNSQGVEEDGDTVLTPMTSIPPIDSTFSAYLDSLRVLWYRNVVNFDHADQKAMVASAQSMISRWISDLQARIGQVWNSMVRILRSPFDWEAYTGLIPLAGIAGVGTLIVFVFRFFRIRWARTRTAEGRVRLRADRWLQRLALSSGLDRQESLSLQAQLLCLRYGPSNEWDLPVTVFKRADVFLRQCHRGTSKRLFER